jgi:RNA polymerase sigma-70 factor, ECF subfamily
MTGRAPSEVTALLQAWRQGDQDALGKIIPLVYDELHRLAHICMMGEHPEHILQTSALVNEAYLHLVEADQVEWKDRAHFLAISANVMRRVLVQFARSRAARKRGGGALKVVLDEAAVPAAGRGADLGALDDALDALGKIDPREAKVVELRFFGGLSEKEVADVLGVSDRTVRQDWNHAKAWLLGELKRGATP